MEFALKFYMRHNLSYNLNTSNDTIDKNLRLMIPLLDTKARRRGNKISTYPLQKKHTNIDGVVSTVSKRVAIKLKARIFYLHISTLLKVETYMDQTQRQYS